MRHDENPRDEVSRDHEGGAESTPTADELRFVQRYADAIDAYVDGTLDAAARLELERAARTDARLRDALADAGFSAAFFTGGEAVRAPRSLDARVFATIDAQAAAETARPVHRSRAPRRALRAWSAAAAVAAVLLFMVVGNSQRWFAARDAGPMTGPVTPGPVTYVASDGSVFTEQEVRDATEQMEVAMAVFGRTMDRTAQAMRAEMTEELRNHVQDPLREGLGRSVNSIPFLRPRGGDQEHSGNIPTPPAGERPLRSRALEGAHIGERT